MSTLAASPPRKHLMIEEKPVIVVDIQMKFWSMVVFLVKLTLAAIPAALLLMLIWMGLTMAFFGFMNLVR